MKLKRDIELENFKDKDVCEVCLTSTDVRITTSHSESPEYVSLTYEEFLRIAALLKITIGDEKEC